MKLLIWGLVASVIILIGFGIYKRGYGDGVGAQKKEQTEKRRLFSGSGEALWGMVNAYKKEHKLPLLKLDNKLCEFAQKRSGDIINDWSHDNFTNGLKLIYNTYCPTCTGMGENLAKEYFTANEVMEAWTSSASHKKELDTAYTKGCIDIRISNNEAFVALEMAK